MVKRTALVPGALGVTGRAIIEHLDNNPNWNIIGLSRRPPNYNSKAKFLSVDLLNRSECNSIAEHLAETTHVFFVLMPHKTQLKQKSNRMFQCWLTLWMY